jgi:lipopolysaccharide assembly outer membrane protein LptD (OstA)
VKLPLAAFSVCALAFAAQDNPADQRKHLSVPTTTYVRPVSVAAAQIERGPQYPSIIHLKGDVEIRTPVRVATGTGTELACAGYVVLRADQADFHEDSGAVEASGNVRVTREK